MKNRNPFATFALINILAMSSLGECRAQVPQVPRYFMGGIARATTDRSGRPVVYYNPIAMRRIGPQVSEFFLAHEHAHHQLNHLRRPISVRQAEAEADRLAARIASPTAVSAARQWFLRGNGGSRQHGSAYQRASRIGGVQWSPTSYYSRPAPVVRYRVANRTRSYSGRRTVYRMR